MIKYFKEQLKLRRLRAQIRPDKQFLRSTREEFLNLAKQRVRVQGFVPARASYAYVYRFAGFVVVVAISMTSGLAAFAAKNDVRPDHPLYELKRLTEQVELKVSSPVKKFELHEKFAQRRIKEISALEEKIPAVSPVPAARLKPIPSPEPKVKKANKKDREVRIEKLKNDLQQEVDKTIDQAEKLNLNRDKQTRICNGLLETLQKDPTRVNLVIIERLEAQCAKNLNN